MTKENLRMQMLAGVITESEYKAKLQELNTESYLGNDTYSHAVDGLRARMERGIAQINSKNLSDEEKEKRIDNIKFAVYNSIDPNTNGGERPPKDFKFDDNWWASTYETAGDFAIQVAFDDIRRAVDGESFSGTMDENKKSINEHFVAGGIVGVGAINNPFEGRKKTDYELAFEHFLGERYETKFENREQDLEEDKDSDVYEAEEMEEGWKVKSSKEGESSPEHYDYTEYEWVDDEEEDLDEGKEVEEPNNY